MISVERPRRLRRFSIRARENGRESRDTRAVEAVARRPDGDRRVLSRAERRRLAGSRGRAGSSRCRSVHGDHDIHRPVAAEAIRRRRGHDSTHRRGRTQEIIGTGGGGPACHGVCAPRASLRHRESARILQEGHPPDRAQSSLAEVIRPHPADRHPRRARVGAGHGPGSVLGLRERGPVLERQPGPVARLSRGGPSASALAQVCNAVDVERFKRPAPKSEISPRAIGFALGSSARALRWLLLSRQAARPAL